MTIPEAEAYIEARAHESGKQRYDDAFRKVKVLHGFLLLLFAERLGLHVSGHADDGYAGKRHDDAYDYGHRQVVRIAGEHRRKYCAESRARAEGDALAEGHAEVTHREAERQSAYTPKHAEEHRPQRRRGVGRVEFHKPVPVGHCEHGAEKREYNPGEHALDKPIRLPAPQLYLIYRHVTT